MSNSFCDPIDYSTPGSSVHGISQEKKTGVGCHFFLQGIFPIQGLNWHLLHCRQVLYHWATSEAPHKYQYIVSIENNCFIVQNSYENIYCSHKHVFIHSTFLRCFKNKWREQWIHREQSSILRFATWIKVRKKHDFAEHLFCNLCLNVLICEKASNTRYKL